MNFKLLTAATLLVTIGFANSAQSANEELSTLKSTGKCIECNLSKADISEQKLRDANLGGTNLYKTNFTDSDLRDANFSDSNSQRANFEGADLRNADFSYANLSGASFCYADLRGVNWKSITYDKGTECLPDEALVRVSTDRNNSSNSKPSITENVKTVRDNTRSVKETADTVKDIFKLF